MSGPPDFSTSINFGDTAFGFISFRHETYLVAGKEGFWIHVPSWAFALGVLGLALGEWAVFRFVIRAGWRKLRQRKPLH
jgi:hypothetical protein